MHELLSVAQMRGADQATIAAGTPGIDLMENAGEAVFRAAAPVAAEGRAVTVACGAGNNGGDGFVTARHLAAAGFEVRVAMAGPAGKLAGDARLAFDRWGAGAVPLDEVEPAPGTMVIDALLGAGLDRPVSGGMADFISRCNAAGIPVVSVDLPSGVEGDTGQVMGVAVRACRTVTFCRKKPGHLLMPGRTYCGDTIVADIGIPDSVVSETGTLAFENGPALWLNRLPLPAAGGHKYDRGHVLVLSGDATHTGAARLCAGAALRIGAGLVTLGSPADAIAVNAGHLTDIMLRECNRGAELGQILSDRRINAVALGPALGIGEKTREMVAVALAGDRATVLDADALTSFADSPHDLFDAIGQCAGPVVLTPHAGEFARLFADLAGGTDRIEMARKAAMRCGGVVVIKGPDTIVASPDGRIAVNASAPPWLATAGAGDVLAGMVCGLLGNGMDAFGAASAAVWIHGRAAILHGPGLVATDLLGGIAAVLARFHCP